MKIKLLYIFLGIMLLFNAILVYVGLNKSNAVSLLSHKIETVDNILTNDSVLINVNLAIGSLELPNDIVIENYPFQYRLIYRYSSKMCQACVLEGAELFKDVFGSSLYNEFLIVRGESDFIKEPYQSVTFENEFLSLDRSEKPYFILINKYGQILFFVPIELKDIHRTRSLLTSIKKFYFPNSYTA